MSTVFRGIRENIALKVISLASAIVISVYVGVSETPPAGHRDFNAEVVAIGTPPPDLVVRLRMESVRVTVRGPKDEIDKLAPDAIKAIVDVGVAQANTTRIPIARYSAPMGAKKLEYDASRMYVSAEIIQKARKRLSVSYAYANEPPPGRQFAIPRLDPSSAEVVGAPDDIGHVVRLMVYIGTQGGSIRRELRIRPLDANGVVVDSVRVDPPNTNVELDLVEAPTTRTLVVSAAIRGRPSPPFVVTDVVVEPAQVAVSGRSDELVRMTQVTTVDIPIDGIKEDAVRDVALQLPSSVALKDGRTTVRVIVKVGDSSKSGAAP